MFSFILNFSFLVISLQAPWHNSSENATPWGGGERKELRNSFFQKLNSESSSDLGSDDEDDDELNTPQIEATAAPVVIAKNSFPQSLTKQEEDEGDLSNIPWTLYQKEFKNFKIAKSLAWPVRGGNISSGYGLRNGTVHEGIDIRAPYGTLIRAIAPGRVVFRGTISGYGQVLVVYHGSGISSVYAHNSVYIKEKGELVKKGEPIARVGNSGHATGAHCHLEIRKNGVPTNPLQYSYDDSPMIAQK